MNMDFTTKANGPVPSNTDTDQTIDIADTEQPGAAPVIINGTLTNTISAPVQEAFYFQVDLGAELNQVGASFTFTPGTTSGSVALIIWQPPGIYFNGPIPNSPCHFDIQPTHWTYSSFSLGKIATLASGNFAVPLTQDGITVYSSEVDIAGDTATLHLPDGTTTTVTSPIIAENAGTVDCQEIYQNNASTETKGAFTKAWAGYTLSAYVGQRRPIDPVAHHQDLLACLIVADPLAIPAP